MSTPHVLRMGRISYLNVLPVYHPLEAGILPHDFELVSGPPALLNEMMSRGELHVSSCSCFEYARRPERYYLVGDLSIGSRGPVMSVLLLSRLPVEELGGHEILISGESHTSVALLRLLMRDRYKLDVRFSTGPVTPALRSDTRPRPFWPSATKPCACATIRTIPTAWIWPKPGVTGQACPSFSGSGWSAGKPRNRACSAATPAPCYAGGGTGACPTWM